MIPLLYILPTFLLGSAPTLAGDAENMAAVLGIIETINERRLDELGDCVADDIASTPDSVKEIETIIGSGVYVALRATLAATQTVLFGPFPPSGKKIQIPFMDILRIEDRKAAEIWVEPDNLNALVQLGHFPPPGQPVEQ